MATGSGVNPPRARAAERPSSLLIAHAAPPTLAQRCQLLGLRDEDRGSANCRVAWSREAPQGTSRCRGGYDSRVALVLQHRDCRHGEIEEPCRTGSGFGSNWTTYHGNAEATGVHAAHTKLRPSRRAWTSPVLDGQLYGEPLVADGRVVAATENDTVYVMAADSGQILWSRHLATPVPSSDLPCGDISPEVGITGTPVIDLTRSEIFVDADTLINGPSASRGVEASHRLFGLNLFTGKVELDEQAMPNAGEDQLAQLQRPGLALDRRFRGHRLRSERRRLSRPQRSCPRFCRVDPGAREDSSTTSRSAAARIGERFGWAAALRLSTLTGTSMWQAPTATTSAQASAYDDSDAVLELSPTMHLESIFYPKDWQKLSADDLDLGTGDPVLVDGFVLQVGKTDTAYLLRQGHLGGKEGEVASISLCSGNPDGGRAVKGSVVYVPVPERRNGDQGSDEGPVPEATMDRHRRRRGRTDHRRRAGLDDWKRQRRARPQPGQRPSRSSRSPSGRLRTTSRRRLSAMGCCSCPAPTRSSPSRVRPGCRRHPPEDETARRSMVTDGIAERMRFHPQSRHEPRGLVERAPGAARYAAAYCGES